MSKSLWGMKLWWVVVFVGLVIINVVEGLDNVNVTDIDYYVNKRGSSYRPLMVGISLIYGAAAKGAGIFFLLLLFYIANELSFCFDYLLFNLWYMTS